MVGFSVQETLDPTFSDLSMKTGTTKMNHQSEVLTALDRSLARRIAVEDQLRSLRGTALCAALAELDSLLVYEVHLEARLTEVRNRNRVTSAC